MIRAHCLPIVLASLIGSVSFAQSQELPRAVPAASPEQITGLSHHRFYALLIAIDRYRDQSLPSLQTPFHDAEALHSVLAENFGFTVKLLKDATRYEVITTLEDYRSRLPEDSSLLIFFAGQSLSDSETKRAYWMPSDAETGSRATWISTDEITGELRAFRARHVLVVADACYSGDTMRDARGSEVSAAYNKLFGLKSRTLMASCGSEPIADTAALGGHSVFVNALLTSLQKMPGDILAASVLFRDISSRVEARSGQSPVYAPIARSDDDLGEFIFVRRLRPAPPWPTRNHRPR